MEEKITIIYVFGPKKCYEDYQNNICLDTDGTWVKIGQTNITCNLSDFDDISCLKNDIYNKSLYRIKQEVRTGIPVITKLYDAYIFPHESRKTDGEIRDILCKELYSLENSKANNKNLEDGDIPAGEEFVYGVCKKNIQNAINNYVSIALLRCDKNHELSYNCNKFNNFMINKQFSEAGHQTKSMVGGWPNDDQHNMPNNLKSSIFDNIKTTETDDKHTKVVKRKSPMNHDTYLGIGKKVFLVKNQKYGEDKEHIYVRDNDGHIVECEYIGGNKFKGFDGTIGSSSTLAIKYFRQFIDPKVITANGNEHWEYNGKRLIDYRID